MAAQQLPPVDVVTIGVGMTGSILGKELTDAGLKVVGIERGHYRDTVPDFTTPRIHDDLQYGIRHALHENPARETLTFRNNTKQTALPMRQLGSFLPGEGLGGAMVHWNGATWRFLPYDISMRSMTEARYGAAAIPADCTIQDWGVTAEELEPYFDQFEYMCGISGKAGNINGQIQEGGNPFEAPRSREYPTPPLKRSQANILFKAAAEKLGYHPFPMPAANLSQPYTNPYGQSLGACDYCGYCERFACEFSAKSSPQVCILPALLSSPNYELRTDCYVLRINLDSTGKQAVSVTYVDAMGRELEQPASIILVTAYQLHNVRLLLLSGIGTPYDPATGEGVVGKNYSYQCGGGASLYFEDQFFNPFIGSGAMSTSIDDFNGDNFDHTGMGFIGGTYISAGISGGWPSRYRPVPPGTPAWGSAWKAAVAKYYNRSMSIGGSGCVLSYRGNYLDLDPTYRDIYGQPLLRMTFDWGDNEIRLQQFISNKSAAIARAVEPAPATIAVGRPSQHYNIVPYQSTHNIGGAIMGTDPSNSVVNKYLQSWDVPNVFVIGASAFPQNSSYNPTGTVGAVAYWAAAAIKDKYVKNPGPLA